MLTDDCGKISHVLSALVQGYGNKEVDFDCLRNFLLKVFLEVSFINRDS